MKQAVALDVGTKTIGVAASDGLGMLAHPVVTVARQGVRKDCEAILRHVADRDVGCWVVGLPLELDGGEQRSAKLARQVGEAIGALTGLPVHYQDERYSSVMAERRLIDAGKRRAARKLVIDQEAAVVILQGWLDEGGRAALGAAGGA